MYRGKKVLVITGGYNEEGKIGSTIRKIPWEMVDECVAIDDGSVDDTAKEAREAGAKVLKNMRNMGPGYVLKKGIRYGLRKKYDIMVILAGDGQDNPREIPELIKPLAEGYDFVQGSRYLGKRNKIPLFRWIATKVFTVAFRLIGGVYLTDASNGFRAFRADFIRRIGLPKELYRYDFEPYLLLSAAKKYKFKEVAVSKYYPRNGYSKMIFRDWYGICKPLIREIIR